MGAKLMSVEQPLWRALTGYRILAVLYVLGVFFWSYREYSAPVPGGVYLLVLACWTFGTLRNVGSADRCTLPFLVTDIVLGVVGILLSPVVDGHGLVGPTLPSIWVAGPVLAFALKGGWRWAAGASVLVGIANIVERGMITRSTFHNVLLVCVASVAIGYVIEVARASERTLARALQIEAATRERERLARDIHDSVLQVLAMVQRRGTALGGEAAELGRMAGEQEVALRALVSSGVVPEPGRAPTGDRWPALATDGGNPATAPDATAPDATDDDTAPCDVRALLSSYATSRVTFSEPGAPVLLPARAATELAAAVGAALDNVARHAGGGPGGEAHAWILLEDEPDAVLVTVRDDGPGIPAGRLADAEAEGRMGVALSIRGRLRDLGGTAELVSVPGQGTEVEMRVPKHDN
ncbi:MacS family sensor histidine kinase [Streptomyces sp. CA-250714]|uniref:MacS family sensor histidine kinase n=1 Tax=Streptomyces sp. CA-250714 TaxID=3240060 RepID=UPI003D913366